MGFNVLFQLLGGVWFAGNPEASIICTVYGQNFDYQSDMYITDLKMAHYAKLPPRAVFRGQVLSVILSCFVFVGMLDWMVEGYDDGTLCTWDNKQHFVCTNAVLVFASAIEYGAFGVRNMFTLYPILPWCFVIGALVGIFWAVARLCGPSVHDFARKRFSEAGYLWSRRYIFAPLALLKWFNPAVFWAGSLNCKSSRSLCLSSLHPAIICIDGKIANTLSTHRDRWQQSLIRHSLDLPLLHLHVPPQTHALGLVGEV